MDSPWIGPHSELDTLGHLFRDLIRSRSTGRIPTANISTAAASSSRKDIVATSIPSPQTTGARYRFNPDPRSQRHNG